MDKNKEGKGTPHGHTTGGTHAKDYIVIDFICWSSLFTLFLLRSTFVRLLFSKKKKKTFVRLPPFGYYKINKILQIWWYSRRNRNKTNKNSRYPSLVLFLLFKDNITKLKHKHDIRRCKITSTLFVYN